MDDENFLTVGEDGSPHQIQQFCNLVNESLKEILKNNKGYPTGERTRRILQYEVDKLYGYGAFVVEEYGACSYCVKINDKNLVKNIMVRIVTDENL